jgi:hypothetical protein
VNITASVAVIYWAEIAQGRASVHKGARVFDPRHRHRAGVPRPRQPGEGAVAFAADATRVATASHDRSGRTEVCPVDRPRGFRHRVLSRAPRDETCGLTNWTPVGVN